MFDEHFVLGVSALEHSNMIVIMLMQLCFTGLAFKQWVESAAVALGWYVITTSFSAFLELSHVLR